MPKISVEIEWDDPEEEYWMNKFNVQLCLETCCPNTRFIVRDIVVKQLEEIVYVEDIEKAQ